jgi:DNA-binding transcriptional regulator GbsR (MarR family)
MVKQRETELAEFQELLYDFFEDIIYERGGSPLLGRMFAKLLFSEIELKQGDLAKEFVVTTATISRNLKTLENWHLITKKGERGSREWLYTTDSNSFFELFCGQLSELFLNLQDRKEAIITLNSNWNKLDDNNKQSLEWNQFQKIIEKLKDWIIIYEEELNKFFKDLKERFYSL